MIMGLKITSESHLGKARVMGLASLTFDREVPLAEMAGRVVAWLLLIFS